MQYNPRPSIIHATPRSPAGTPRSSRRLTVSHTPGLTPLRASTSALPAEYKLPSLDLFSYPDRPFSEDGSLDERIAEDWALLDESVFLLQKQRSERKSQLASALAYVADEKRKKQDKIRQVGDTHKEMGLLRERHLKEEQQARADLTEAAAVGREKLGEMESIRSETNDVQLSLKARRAEKARQREAFNRQLGKNAGEIEFFEETLALKIRGKPGDVVRFKFTNIDPHSTTRQFAFDINASLSQYSLAELTPSDALAPGTATRLLAELNRSRDFYGFVRKMRLAFRVAFLSKEERDKAERELEEEDS